MDLWEEELIQAPQWIDLNGTPDVSDDFFSNNPEEPTLISAPTPEKYPLSTLTQNEFVSELNKVNMTPVKIIPSTPKGKENSSVITETTVEDFLEKAMSNLQLSVTKSGRKTCQVTTSFCETPSSAYHTPSGVLTRSMSAKKKCLDLYARRLGYEHADHSIYSPNLSLTPRSAMLTRSMSAKLRAFGLQPEYKSLEDLRDSTPGMKMKTPAKASSVSLAKELVFDDQNDGIFLENVQSSLKFVDNQSETEETPSQVDETTPKETLMISPKNIECALQTEEILVASPSVETLETSPKILKHRKSLIPVFVAAMNQSEECEVNNSDEKESMEPQIMKEAEKEMKDIESVPELADSTASTSAPKALTPVDESQLKASKLPRKSFMPSNDRLPMKRQVFAKHDPRQSVLSTKPIAVPNVFAKHNPRQSVLSTKPTALPNKSRFVSMAEAITKFQSGTPERFHSKSNRILKPDCLQNGKRLTTHLTMAVSPALRSKSRTRTPVLASEERELKEMEKFRNQPIKANPIPKNVYKMENLKAVPKKPNTVFRPFQLTEIKKSQISQTLMAKPKVEAPKPQSAMKPKVEPPKVQSATKPKVEPPKVQSVMKPKVEPPKVQSVMKPKVEPPKVQSVMKPKVEPPKVQSATKVQAPKASSATKPIIDNKPRRTLHIPSSARKSSMVVGVDNNQVIVKQVNVLHFGIPINSNTTKATSSKPFSFDRRKKDTNEQKIKQAHEATTAKPEFHARPVPKAIRSAPSSLHGSRENVAPKPNTTPCPFSFGARNKLMLQKKTELVKQASEAENKTRIFRASPVPNFKQTLVRGLSRDNLKKTELGPLGPLKAVYKDENKAGQQVPKKPLLKAPLFPVKAKTQVGKIELSTDKRAKERQEFDEKMRQKQEVDEKERLKKLDEQAMEQKAENEALRKAMEVKAIPMPEFKPVKILKSEKQLTDPLSPGWSRKKQ